MGAYLGFLSWCPRTVRPIANELGCLSGPNVLRAGWYFCVSCLSLHLRPAGPTGGHCLPSSAVEQLIRNEQVAGSNPAGGSLRTASPPARSGGLVSWRRGEGWVNALVCRGGWTDLVPLEEVGVDSAEDSLRGLRRPRIEDPRERGVVYVQN